MQPNIKLRGLLKSKKFKTNSLRELSKIAQNRLAQLNVMLNKPRSGENVKNRWLATWLTEDEYGSFESDGERQQHQ